MSTDAEYQFTLTRRQRLASHLHTWRRFGASGLLAIAGLSAAFILLRVPWWAWTLPLSLSWLLRGFFIELVRIAWRAEQLTSISVTDRGVGFGTNSPDHWISVDGIVAFVQTTPDLWILLHHNGTVLTIPTTVLSHDHAAFLSSKARPKT